MSIDKIKLRQTLALDIVQQNKLLGVKSHSSGFKFWIGILSPRFLPVLLYRLSYKSQVSGFATIARFFSLINFLLFGIEIATVCKIGPGLFFPHTHGTVIGAVSIGNNAVIYQGVTLGAKDLDFTYDELHRPCVGHNVMIGAGAKVLGGLTLGNNVSVAANSVLLVNAPDNSVVAGVPAKVVSFKTLDSVSVK
ncbi:serine O-acetyltransferase [Pseudomonas sp. M30-35]|uniref:serine O-acetyltransferase n=1 Tax=Pseudomonas sp. M30-35 TaxID=1981174 RepID=UPI000B57CB99|nr:hypothetical protein [Pseudomonas sp. M30-35]ARU88048.1 hypothetical protein B9K09_08750 [Pseudomonas sp. M30-35]